MAGIGFNIQHDGNHGAYSRHPAPEQGRRAVAEPARGRRLLLALQAQHRPPHLPEHLGRGQRHLHGPVRAHVAARPALLVPPLPAHLHLGAVFDAGGEVAAHRRFSLDDRRPGVADTSVARPRGWNQVNFWAGKACFMTLAVRRPAARRPSAGGRHRPLLRDHGGPRPDAGDRVPARPLRRGGRVPSPGATGRAGSSANGRRHQIETAVDFARDNRLLTWYLGGLNFQIEHHLFPKICHVHYPAISPIVEATCRDHGIRHRSHRTMRRAIRSHVRWLRHLGRDGAAQPA